ncbi:hypothetical protein HU200_044294 [Digitaria exilis]|uniref:rRNA N-glycosylase n=1 Tax=Digitaria exilis TaxID=1010633 RepID=A0A835EGR3_9POAL|nr:hypothetical protein HU200_044294 [Digitaria exilis]
MTVHKKMKEWIYENRYKDPKDLEGYPDHPKLVEQQLEKKPPHWFIPILMGRGNKYTSLSFRSDNLYLSAFTNAKGELFSFKLENPLEFVVPGSRVLNFKSNYGDLVADGRAEGEQSWQYLADLRIDYDAVQDSVDVVSEYDPQTTPDRRIKRAVATLIVVFMESQRFPCIRQAVRDAWMSGGGKVKLGQRGAQLVVNWKRISCAVRIWDSMEDKGKWDSTEAKKLKQEPPAGLRIATPEEALCTIWPIVMGRCSY